MCYSLADFIAPVGSGRQDYLGRFAVTTGIGCDELARQFDADHDDYNSIMVKAIADRLAEAFAECLHARARREWGYGKQEDLSNEDLIAEKYRGIRPAAGYPSQPDHTEKRTLFDLLEAAQRPASSSPNRSPCTRRPASAACILPIPSRDTLPSTGSPKIRSKTTPAARACRWQKWKSG